MNIKNILLVVTALFMVIVLCSCGGALSETTGNQADSKEADFLIGNWIYGEYDEYGTPMFYSADFKADNTVLIVDGIPNSDFCSSFVGTWSVVDTNGKAVTIEFNVDRHEYNQNEESIEENQRSTMSVMKKGEQIVFSYEEKIDDIGLVTDKVYDKGEWSDEYEESISLEGLPLTAILKIGYWYDFNTRGIGTYECTEYSFDANGNVNVRTLNYETDTAEYYGEFSAYYYDVDKSAKFMYMITKSDLRTLNSQWYYDSEKDLLYSTCYDESTGKEKTNYLVHYRSIPGITTIKQDSKLYK